MARKRHLQSCPIRSGVVFLALVLFSAACETTEPPFASTQRLNETQGSVVGGFMPDYTALSVRDAHVATAWIGRSASGRQEITLRFSSDAGETWGPEQRFGLETFPDSEASDPRLYRFPGSTDLLVLWEVSSEAKRRRAIMARTSPDEGETFASPQTLSQEPRVYEPVALTRGVGVAVTVWERESGGRRELVVTDSDSGGRGWEGTPRLLDSSLAGFSRQPSLVSLPDGRVLAAWPQRGRENRGGATRPHLRVSVGSADGRRWSPSLPVDPEFEGTSPFRPRAIHADGRSSLAWTTAVAGRRGRGAVVFSQSTDGARTWSAPREIFVGEEAPFAVLQSSGKHAYLSWHGGPRKDVGIYFLASADGGTSWLAGEPTPRRLDDPLIPGNALRPSMQNDGKGRVVVVWTNGFKQVWLRASSDHGINWSEPILIAEEPGRGELKFPQVEISGARAFVTWERWPDKALHVKSIADVGKSLPLDFFFRSVELPGRSS